MNGVLQFAFINKQADRLAIYVLGESGIAVACEAVLILELVLGLDRAG